MRLLGAGFASVIVLLSALAIPADASAKTRPAVRAQARLKATPAPLTVSPQSFRAFGTKFCNPDASPLEGCQQTVPAAAMTVPAPRPEHGARGVFLGVSFCEHPEATGPNCDVAWVPPQPAQPWRDAPEMRANDVMPRPL